MISKKLKNEWKNETLKRLEGHYTEGCAPAPGSVTRVITWMTEGLDIDDKNFWSKDTAAHFKEVSQRLIEKRNSPTFTIAEHLMNAYEDGIKPG